MTTLAMPALHGQSRIALLVGAGVVLGVAYTLSPLSVLALTALAFASHAAGKGLSEAERRWFWSLMSISVLIRLVAIALLFYTADPAHPFASFFGDEELYKFRTMWLRNVGEGLPMSPADVIYSYDDVGHTSYVYVLAYVQALVGDAPYGLHVLNMVLYFCGILGLYRFVRASYGGVVAMGGLILLLFLPSLGLWSISVLKEPMNVFMIATELICAVAIVRAPRWWQKVLALVVVVAAAAAMESLRTGGALTAAAGTIGGLSLAFVLSRGRRLAVAMIAAPIAVALVAGVPAVQNRAMANVRAAAFYHAGHVLTQGYSYQLVNPRYYANRVQLLNSMPAVDAGRFVVKALWSYFVQPLPSQMQSRTMLAYLPEQIAWYVIALLLPFGVYAGLRRDMVLTSVLAAHAAAAILIVALTSGNIGTLIRHRALALPYVVWLSAVGAHEGMRRIADRRAVLETRSGVNGDG
jgi:hypothetical protein